MPSDPATPDRPARFLDHTGPAILRWMGRLGMVVTSGLVALCLIGAVTQPESRWAWLGLLVGDAFLTYICWDLAGTEDSGDA